VGTSIVRPFCQFVRLWRCCSSHQLVCYVDERWPDTDALSCRIDCNEQVVGVENSYRGCKTVAEAKAAFAQKQREGKVKTVQAPSDSPEDSGLGDSFDDVPFTPSAASRATRSRTGGSSTPASSASRRCTPARERARADETRSAYRAPPSESEGETSRQARRQREDGGRQSARSRGYDDRARERSPPQDGVRIKTEDSTRMGVKPESSTKTRKKATRNAAPVSVDSDSEGPPLDMGRIRRTSRAGQAKREPDEQRPYVSVSQPACYESISNLPSPKATREPVTRESTLTTDYHTADSASSSSMCGTPTHSRTSSADTSSSPSTGVSQYEDPLGTSLPNHEWKRAAKKSERSKLGDATKIRHVVPDPEEGLDTEPDSTDERLGRPSNISTGSTSPPRRAHTEPISVPTRPNTPSSLRPVRIGKSKSIPAPAGSNTRWNLAYAVCKGCKRPVPKPPLSPSEEFKACCRRCFQPIPRVTLFEGAGGSTSKSRTPVGSRRAYSASESSTGSLDQLDRQPDVKKQEDVFGMLAMTSALPRPSIILDPFHDPRSPMLGHSSLPMRYALCDIFI
jgi:hypothetical protein